MLKITDLLPQHWEKRYQRRNANYVVVFEGREVPGIIGAVLALGVVFPAWRLAVARISRPPNRT